MRSRGTARPVRTGLPEAGRALALLISIVLLLPANLAAQRVRIGAEVLLSSRMEVLRGKRVGVVCNHTSVLPDGTHLVDTLLRRGVNITVLFGPEHGIRGDVPPGRAVEQGKDPRTGLPVYSLYGGTRKPGPEVLSKVDLILFDIQDVGARFYTYASTMAYVMEAAADNGKTFVVLDRPNPINGVSIEGPVLDLRLISFVGLFPIPVRHGLTLGELARMIVGEGYINPSTVDLVVIPMQGWKRSMWYDQTGLPWVAPSPNIKTLATATVYPGTCFLEATNISEGRGTGKPFENIGAPGLDAERVIAALEEAQLPGVRFVPIRFTPRPDSVAAPDPKFKNTACRGIEIRVTDRTKFKPVLTGVMLLGALKRLYPRKFVVKEGLLDHLTGDEIISQRLEQEKLGRDVFITFGTEMAQYARLRRKYLLY